MASQLMRKRFLERRDGPKTRAKRRALARQVTKWLGVWNRREAELHREERRLKREQRELQSSRLSDVVVEPPPPPPEPEPKP